MTPGPRAPRVCRTNLRLPLRIRPAESSVRVRWLSGSSGGMSRLIRRHEALAGGIRLTAPWQWQDCLLVPPRQGRCPICRGFFRLDESQRLPIHDSIISGKSCRGRNPKGGGEYPVGFDGEPRWVMGGGLPTLGKRSR